MGIIRILIGSLVIILLCREAGAQTSPTNACTETDRTKLVSLAAVPGAQQVAQVVLAFSRAPAGDPADLVVDRPFPTDPRLTYRIAFQLGESDKPPGADVRVLENRDIGAKSIPDDHPLRTLKVVGQGTTLLSFQTPQILTGSDLFQVGAITVIGCDSKNEVSFIGHSRTTYSNGVPAIVLTVSIAFFLYIFIVIAVANYENRIRVPQLNWYRFLDPVVLSSDANGVGSISRLQILFFSVLLFCLLFYILIRVGLLSDMSSTVLLLLGISGVGAAAANGTDTQRKRLKFENWAWLLNKNWLPPNGVASVNVARWRDIVSGSDGFDVYRFQMLIFSLVVGIALLQVGFRDLAGFQIPQAMLAVLGLSQVIYIGGKLVEPPTVKNLDDALDKLTEAEGKFADAAVRQGVVAPASPNDPPTAAVAAMDEYRVFDTQRKLVVTMFESLFGPMPAGAVKQPRYT